jgi:Astacin (Peptidase family M12A)/Bacterial pre-peptidase C-terminal domain
MSELPKVCCDKILPDELFTPQPPENGTPRAAFEYRKMWINGTTLRVRFLDGTPQQQTIAKEQALWWSEYANLTFDFNNAADAEIRIAFDPKDGAWSYIGTDCLGIKKTKPTMNLGFLDGGTAAHEFGHAIGLGHEHQNPSGGIEWNEPSVIRDLAGQPNKWDEATVRHNVLNKYSANQIRGTQFDPDSIMLYFFPASWTKNGKATKANEVLSAQDKAFISSGAAYPRTASPGVELVTNAAATSASIGAPGEEDLYKFTVASAGNYVIETGGETDVVMKLFGPNSQTVLIATDDDGGTGLNSRIAATLNPGQYFAQIRHYNKANGTGAYTIRLSS